MSEMLYQVSVGLRPGWQPGGAGWSSEQAQTPQQLLSEKFPIAAFGVVGIPREGQTVLPTHSSQQAQRHSNALK